MMKKSLLVLTAALSFGFAAAQDTAPAAPAQAPTLTDVPAGHWAKDAIDRLVERGIILGYPDGTFRGTQNLTRYEAAVIIARVLDQIRTGEVTVTETSVFTAEDLTALQNAIQELAADLTALGVRVSDLEENAVNRDDFSRLEARVEEIAGAGGDETAITGIQTQIDELTARADEYDTLRADIDDNASSIAALNDLTVLLNQDILNLQDRVSAAEAAQADFVTRTDFDNLSGRVTAVDNRVTGVAGRVTTLENAPKFSISGNIDAAYGRINLISGTQHFDVDRLTRQTFADGVFSSGVNCPTGAYAASGNAVSCTDTNNQTFTGGIGFGVKASNLVTANGTIVVNDAAINFYTNNSFAVGNDVSVNVDNASASGTISGQKFDVNYHNGNSKFKFNDYLFANDNDTEGAVTRRGAVINIEATQLPLAPKLTVVAGNARDNKGSSILEGNYYGVRASVNPGGIGTVGVSFAQMDGLTSAGRSAYGVDYDVKFGPVGITGAGVASVQASPATFVSSGGTFQNAVNSADYAFYTDVKADFGVVKAAANYRAIEAAYANGEASMSGNDSAYYTDYKTSQPYGADQVGFGGALSTNLGPVVLGAYGDSYVPYNNGDRNTSFGVSGGVKFGALSAVGFYNRATLTTGTSTRQLAIDANNFAYNLGTPYMDTATVPFAFSSTFGGVLKHDGAATNALIPGLSFTVADAYFYGLRRDNAGTVTVNDTLDGSANDLQVYGSYSGTFAGVKIEPFARYHLFKTTNDARVFDQNAAANATTTATTANIGTSTYNTVKYGVKLSTQPLTGVPLQPSFFANFANRLTTPGSQTQVITTSATELFGQAGITLNQFLVPNMKASLGYAYYQGFNVASTINASSASAASATYSAAADRIYSSPFSGGGSPFINTSGFGTANGKVDGVFGQLSWNGIAANYGVFRNTNLNDNTTSVAQGFKVNYTFKF
ncbi:S-layer homology domain-containing protein [Deinococcus sp. QL22]|uniref:S-layer homology domain-containing protein n=1 Tax=Deinococcus sp. QL22 TaxID=2939437 RepID=UPI002016E08C|nr:S-layer homology domain-containing protein [Deinococcus sp. QL22]UQN07684.1 S-layer homology domain-containing protein [Deinococcus sp. QL22]